MGLTDREVGLNFRAIYLWLQGGLHFQNRQDQMESKSQTLNNNAEVDTSRILGPSHFTQICWTSLYLCHAEGTSPTTNHPLRPGFMLHLLWLVSVFLLQEFELKWKTLYDCSLEAGCAHWIPSQHTERTLGPACKIHASVISHPQTWALFRELESPSCPPYFVLVSVCLTCLQPSEKAWNIPSLFVNTPEFSPAYHLSSLPTLVMHLQSSSLM
jgi:hypothetical protein